MDKWRNQLIVGALGYGYLSSFVFRRLCNLGVIGIGVTSKNNNYDHLKNISILDWKQTQEAISFTSHLLITAPPQNKGCPIFNDFSEVIYKSNIRSVIYISSTGVYGNHNGVWVNEDSPIRAKSFFDKNRVIAEEQWQNFCKNNHLSLNIIRLSGIYGPQRVLKITKGKPVVVLKENHYFSRVHIYDAARLTSKIILNSANNNIWNISDNKPSSREEFIYEGMKIKKIKKCKTMSFAEYSKNISEISKKFWNNNKKVSNNKIKDYFGYKFIFPTYNSGLRNLKEYL